MWHGALSPRTGLVCQRGLDTPFSNGHYSFMSGAPTPQTSPIGEEIRRVRGELGLTIQEFGRHVGIPWQTIQGYETGRLVPPSNRLLVIVHAARHARKPFQFARVARAVHAMAA